MAGGVAGTPTPGGLDSPRGSHRSNAAGGAAAAGPSSVRGTKKHVGFSDSPTVATSSAPGSPSKFEVQQHASSARASLLASAVAGVASSSRGAKSGGASARRGGAGARASTARAAPRSINGVLVARGFKVLGPIAAGAFSTILHAKHQGSGIEVAVKTFEHAKCADGSSQAEERDRELTVLRIVSAAGHAHIANLLADDASPLGLHAFLHYCGGGSLASHLGRLRKKQMAMAEADAAVAATQIASALAHIHGLRVAHRDVKPANIIYDKIAWRLCDFGFGVQCVEGQRLKAKLGTLLYCAPEILGGSGYVGESVDMWAFGAVLYEMRVGRAAFGADTAETTTLRIRNGFKGGSEGQPWMPHMRKEKALISALLSKAAEERPSAAQVLRHKWLAGHREPPVRRASKPQWWCDVGSRHCLRPTQPTHEGQYPDSDVCFAHPNGGYVVCEACYRTGRARNAELLRRVGGIRVVETSASGASGAVIGEVQMLPRSAAAAASGAAAAGGRAAAAPSTAAAATVVRRTPPPEGAPLFIASRRFDGARPGYVFTTRSEGAGYYWDYAGPAPAPAAAAAGPTAGPAPAATALLEPTVYGEPTEGDAYYPLALESAAASTIALESQPPQQLPPQSEAAQPATRAYDTPPAADVPLAANAALAAEAVAPLAADVPIAVVADPATLSFEPTSTPPAVPRRYAPHEYPSPPATAVTL